MTFSTAWFAFQSILAAVFEIAIAALSPMDVIAFGLLLGAYGTISAIAWMISIKCWGRGILSGE